MVARFGIHERSSRLAPLLVLVLLLCSFLSVCIAIPVTARADDYSIDKVNIDATVAADGSVAVSETREFDFDGSFHGVYWKIPKGSYDGQEISCNVGKVGLVSDGSLSEFRQVSESDADYGEDGTYVVTDEGSYLKLKIYSAHEDETASFQINYTLTNLARRYSDTSELYWKFVSDGWDVESQNVTCTIHLPVPTGQTVKGGDNVRAWGHGPLDASLKFKGNTVVYTVSGVGSDEYAEARIVFPTSWLSNANSVDKSVLDSVLSEEKEAAEKANAERARARAIQYAVTAIGVALAVGSIVLTVMRLNAYRQSHKPQFDDKYFRDVPTNDHPAVLGALLNDGHPTEDDVTASLMRLTDIGAMTLERVELKEKGIFGREKTKEDYQLTRVVHPREVKKSKSEEAVDNATLKLLFNKIGPKVKGREKGELLFSDFERVADSKPEAYNDAYESWKTEVEAQVIQRGFQTDAHGNGKGLLAFLLLADIVLAFVTVVLMVEETIAVGWGLVAVVALAVAAAFAGITIGSMDDLSPEAVEVIAKLKALKRWLKDFTRLEEAVPQDVILWNRLLVMAVSLGVAEEVIEQLKVAAPQVLNDPGMMPVYCWYLYPTSPMGSPASNLGSSFASAHKVSTAALAKSSFSSAAGGGGGFSGGGGGGFGGGGGGGAF